MKKGTKMLIAASLGIVAVAPTAVTTASAAEASLQDGIYVGGSVNKFYTASEFVGFSAAKQLEILSSASLDNIKYVFNGKVASLTAMSANGLNALQTYKSGDLNASYTGTNGTVTPPANGKLSVESVSAINATSVTVAITAPKEDVPGQTLQVKNSAGTVVEVKPLDIAAGDTTADFEFVTTVKAADLKGVWTVAGQSYDLDLFNNLSDFLNATNQLALNKALTDLGVENVKVDNLPAYFTAKGDITKTAQELSLADVQKLVDDVNAKSVDAETEKEIVKAVADAKKAGNEVALLQALQNDAFVRVNPEWVSTATNGYLAKIVGNETTIAAIQTVINTSNDTIIQATYTTTGIDKAKLTASKALIAEYATVNNKGVLTNPTIKGVVDNKTIDIQLALVDVVGATTPTAFKSKLTALATLVGNASTLDIKKYVDANGKAYIAAIKGAVPAVTDVAGVATAIDTVNQNITALVGTEDFSLHTSSGVKGYNVGFNWKNSSEVKNVVVKLYKGTDLLATNTATSKWMEDFAAKGKTNSASESSPFDVFGNFDYVADGYWSYSGWNGAITDIPTKAEITVTFKDGTVVTKENKSLTADTSIFSVEAVNVAKTASEARSALAPVALASIASDNYLELTSSAKLEVAQLFLDLKAVDRTNLTDGKYTAIDDIKADLATVTNAHGILLSNVNTATSFTAMKAALNATEYEAFTKLSASAQLDVAEAFIAKFPYTKISTYFGDVNIRTPYTTLAGIKAGIDAAIKAVNDGEKLPTPPVVDGPWSS